MTMTGRKIAVVINAAWRSYASIDFDGYCHELRRLGHSPTLVLWPASEYVERDFPVVGAEAAEMEAADSGNVWELKRRSFLIGCGPPES